MSVARQWHHKGSPHRKTEQQFIECDENILITEYNDAYFIKLRSKTVTTAAKDEFICDLVAKSVAKWSGMVCLYSHAH